MPDFPVTSPKSSRLFRIGARTLPALLVLACIAAACVAYVGVSTSWRAEINLHATLFTIKIVERFVANHGRWPQSWEELEREPIADIRLAAHHESDWPAVSLVVRQEVSIDFAAELTSIAAQSPMSFTAIKPIGPYYEYRDGADFTLFQATIRTIVEKLPKANH